MAKTKATSKSKNHDAPKMTFGERQNKIFQAVTDRILEQLRAGVIPWRRPWHGLKNADASLLAISFETRTAYSLLNQILLGEPGEYLTFNCIQKHGGHIRKGERSRMVVFADRLVKDDPDHTDENGNPKKVIIPYLKYYNVWHLSQVDGIESRIPAPDAPKEEPKIKPVDAAEAIIDGYLSQPSHPRLVVKHSDKAYYQPSTDIVVVPMMGQYDDVAEYYSTLFHELGHSTGHKDRLARKGITGSDFFGGHEYSKEELVAEMCSAMLVSESGLDAEKAFKNSVGYIQGWYKKFMEDNKVFVWAAGAAEKAAKRILGLDAKEQASGDEAAEAVAA